MTKSSSSKTAQSSASRVLTAAERSTRALKKTGSTWTRSTPGRSTKKPSLEWVHDLSSSSALQRSFRLKVLDRLFPGSSVKSSSRGSQDNSNTPPFSARLFMIIQAYRATRSPASKVYIPWGACLGASVSKVSGCRGSVARELTERSRENFMLKNSHPFLCVHPWCGRGTSTSSRWYPLFAKSTEGSIEYIEK